MKSHNSIFLNLAIGVTLVIVHGLVPCPRASGAEWQKMDSPTDHQLSYVWGTGPDNVFAISYADATGNGPGGLILHYDGTNPWQIVSAFPDKYLTGLWGSSGTDIWAVGHYGAILHYDGTNWEERSEIPGDQHFWDVWGTGPDNAWAVGESIAWGGPPNNGIIWHWNGQQWSLAAHFVGPRGATQFNDVWGRGPDEVYVTGHQGYSSGITGVCYKYDGTSWELYTQWPDAELRDYYDIWGIGDELFVAGQKFSPWLGIALHYTGTAWEQPQIYNCSSLSSASGTSADNVYMVGEVGVVHFDGSSWSQMDSGTSEHLKGVWASETGTVFAVGSTGTILRYVEPAECEPGYRYLTQWGEYGASDGQFSSPHCLDVDSSGHVYVADWYNHRVQKFSSDGTYVTQWGTFGSAPGEFQYPVGVATDSSDNVYVTDWDRHRVQKFTSDGATIIEWGGRGSGDGQFEYIYDLAVDSSGYVYVCDYGNHRVQKFTGNGEYVTQWGEQGSGDGQFSHPVSVEVDGSGFIYVSDSWNHRIQKFTGDGVYISQWGTHGSGDGELDIPIGIAIDQRGNVCVIDSKNNRVQVFTSEGEFVDKFGTYGNGDGQFFHPMDLAFDSAGNAYVSDYGNDRIQKFSYVSCNEAPVVDAGENVQILSVAQGTTVICGTGSDPDGGLLEYRWVEEAVVLLDWTPVPESGQCCLDLAIVPALSVGDHTVTLEVREVGEGELSPSDDMILTVQNSPPEAQPAPTHQVVEIGLDPVVVAADVSDFDGDTLLYEWVKDGEVLESGIVETAAGGATVTIPDLYIAPGDPRFPLGVHTIELIVDDCVNAPVPVPVTVEVKDSTAPSISPLPSVTILWPPNHTLQPVTIAANAFDNGGGAITLAVTVASSEPPDADGDGNTIPDYYIDSVNSETGIIEVRLRSERSGKGDGRTYTITITAADESGNSSEAIVSIRAPHDKRKK